MTKSSCADSSALMGSTVFCNGYEICNCDNSRPTRAADCSNIFRSTSILVEAWLHILRRTERADRDDARRVGREEKMGQQRAIPPCIEFLHVASGPRSAATGNLYRLAAP